MAARLYGLRIHILAFSTIRFPPLNSAADVTLYPDRALSVRIVHHEEDIVITHLTVTLTNMRLERAIDLEIASNSLI